ncbi:MAG: hypothetical protein IJ139_07540 [Bacteroidaceae bacterium]|nr:hypothetical protein [Bacteroidaceae bacterium]
MNKALILASMLAVVGMGGSAQVRLQENNIDEVLKAMTLEEKATLVVGSNRAAPAGTDGNGMLGAHSHQVPGAAGNTQAIPRLGIPSTVLTDGPAGVRISPTRQGDQATYDRQETDRQRDDA